MKKLLLPLLLLLASTVYAAPVDLGLRQNAPITWEQGKRAFGRVDASGNLTTPIFTDPNADRIVFWDDSAGGFVGLTPGTGLGITGTTMSVSGFYAPGGTDVAVADGGTGASTATGGFDVLSPNTTKGDITVRGASGNVRLAAGNNGDILIYDSSATNGIAPYAMGSMTPPAYVSGRYYGPPVSSTMSTTTISANHMRGFPLYIGKRATFTAIGYFATANASSGNAHFGLYTDASGAAGSLVSGSDVTVTNVPTGASTDAMFSSPVTLTPGWYWPVVNVDQNITFTALSSSNFSGAITGIAALQNSGTGQNARFDASQTYGALPGTAPSMTLTDAQASLYLALKAQ